MTSMRTCLTQLEKCIKWKREQSEIYLNVKNTDSCIFDESEIICFGKTRPAQDGKQSQINGNLNHGLSCLTIV